MESAEQRFSGLYERNHKQVYRFIYRSLPDESAAADVMQDTFLNFIRIFKDKPLPPEEQCRMYLYRTARNLLINYGKSYYQRKVTSVSFTEPQQTSLLSTGSSAEDDFISRSEADQRMAAMKEGIKQLPEKERSALILRYNDGYSLENIASVLGVSTATVHRMLKKAEKRLSEKMGNHE